MSQYSATFAAGASKFRPVSSRSAPSASDFSVVLISSQRWITGSAISRGNRIRSWILQQLRQKHLQKSRCGSRMGRTSCPESDPRRPGGLGEANQVRRDGHAHVVPAAQQFGADGGARLGIATTAVTPAQISLRNMAFQPRAPGSAAAVQPDARAIDLKSEVLGKPRLRRRISGPSAFASVGECGDFEDEFAWNEALRLGDALIVVKRDAQALFAGPVVAEDTVQLMLAPRVATRGPVQIVIGSGQPVGAEWFRACRPIGLLVAFIGGEEFIDRGLVGVEIDAQGCGDPFDLPGQSSRR